MKSLIIIIVIVLFIIIIGFSILLLNPKNLAKDSNLKNNEISKTNDFEPLSPSVSIQLSDCNKLRDNNSKKECLLLIAIKEKDSSICEISLPDPQSAGFKEKCTEFVSILNQKTSYCNEFKYSNIASLKEQCLDKMNRDLTKCSDLSCYTGFWEVFNDPKICENIKVTQDREEQYKQTCFKEIATRMLNASLCEKINDETLKVNCKDSVWIHLALIKSDTSLCNNAITPSIVESCKRVIP